MPFPRGDILVLPHEELRHRFILSIPPDGFDTAVQQRLEELRGHLAPVAGASGEPPAPPSADYVARQFGRGVRDGLARDMANEAARHFIRAQRLQPAEPPRLDPMPPGPGGEVCVGVSFEVMPQISVPSLNGLRLPTIDVEPTAGEVDTACAALGLRNGLGQDAPPDHAAAAGEVALLRIRAHRLIFRPDILPNPRAEGASVTDGRPPRGWGIAWRKEEIAAVVGQGEENGHPTLDIRVAGTLSPRVSPSVSLGWAGGATLDPPLRANEEVVLAGRWRLLSGALPPNTRASALIEEGDGSNKVVDFSAQELPPPLLAPLAGQFFAQRFRVKNDGTVSLRPALRLRPGVEAEASFILRLSGLRLMRALAGEDAVQDGEALPDLEAEALAMPVGGADLPGLPPGLAARLPGLHRGDTLSHDLALPVSGVAGPGEARLEVSVSALLQPPPVDEELARHLRQPDLAALRDAMKARLRAARQATVAARRRRGLVDALLARSEVVAPSVLVDQAQAPRQAALRARIAAGRLTPDEHAAGVPALLEALRQDCMRTVRADLLLAAMRQPGDPSPDLTAPTPEERHRLLLDRLLRGLDTAE